MPFFNKSSFWLGLFGLYFALQAVIRVLFGDRLNIDEAEAFLWAQSWAWGYGPQPPVYIWLQRLVFLVTGPTVAGLALLKGLTLWSVFALVFMLLRRWVAPDRIWFAGMASCMLFWLPELVWESQRIRTHNVTVTIATLALLWQMLRLRAAPSMGNYLAVGLIAGVGLLTKWSFAVIFLAAVLALLRGAETRKILFDRKALFWLAIPLALCLPTFGWMANHADIAFASAGKLAFDTRLSPLMRAVTYLQSVAGSILIFLALPFLVLGGLAASLRLCGGTAPSGGAPEERRFVMRVIGLALGLIVLGGLVSGATELRLRWLLPVLVALVPMAALWLFERLGRKRRIGLCALTACLPVLLCVAMGVMLKTDPPFKSLDLDALSRALTKEELAGTVIAKEIIAANMALRLPEQGQSLLWRDPASQLVLPCPDGPLWVLGLAGDPAIAGYVEQCARDLERRSMIELANGHHFALHRARPR